MDFTFPCSNCKCEDGHEVLCPICNGGVTLLEKVGPVFYCECHKCKDVFWISDNEYSTPIEYPRTKKSQYDKSGMIV